MRIKFTSQDDPTEFWIEEYKSLEEITEEFKEGCDIVEVFQCNSCLKDFEADEFDAQSDLCKECSNSMDNHITGAE